MFFLIQLFVQTRRRIEKNEAGIYGNLQQTCLCFSVGKMILSGVELSCLDYWNLIKVALLLVHFGTNLGCKIRNSSGFALRLEVVT